MLPGESLQQLARAFYPHDAAMRRHFIAATMRDNHAVFAQVGIDQKFAQETLIWLPNIKQLSSLAASPQPPRHFLRPAPPAYAAATMAELDALTTRYQALRTAQQQLDARIETLQMNLAEIPAAIARHGKPAPQRLKPSPAARPAQPVPVASSDVLSPPSPWHLLTIMVVLFAGGGVIWLHRRHMAVKTMAEPLPAPSSPSWPMQTAAKPEELVLGNAPSATQLEENFVDDGLISVDEITSIMEEAKVFVALGRTDDAVTMLEDYIATHPRASANPWLYLLDIHRMAGRRKEFTALAKRLHQTFNIIAPQWDQSLQAQIVIPRSLEEFPHIFAKLTASWGKPDAQDILNHLLQDNRGGERQGFSMEVLQEILLLQAILEIRDQLPPL